MSNSLTDRAAGYRTARPHTLVEEPRYEMSTSDSTSLAESFSHMARLRFSAQDRAGALDLLLRLAVQVIPSADSASVTVLSSARYRTLRAHDDQALSLDAAQYRSNVGPCVDAVEDNRQIRTSDYSSWPGFGRRARAVEIESVLSTPVAVSDSVRACLNVYSYSLFSAEAAAVGTVLAEHMGPVIENILDYEKANNLNIELAQALKSRELVALAKGIVMEREQCSESDALRIIIAMSQGTNRKLLDIATDITRIGKQVADG